MNTKSLTATGRRTGEVYDTYKLLWRFILTSLLVLTVSRFCLSALYAKRISQDQIVPLFVGGGRVDLCLIGMLALLPAMLNSTFAHSTTWKRWESKYYQISLLVLFFFEAITPRFIAEYDTRPNRLFFEYLGHVDEVTSMLLRGFGMTVLVILLAMGMAVVIVTRLYPQAPTQRLPHRVRVSGVMVASLLCFTFIRGTLAHRPLNPSTVAFSSDRMLNTLALNSTYSLLYSLYRMKDEKNSSELYGKMQEEEMHQLVRHAAGLGSEILDHNRPSLHYSKARVAQESPPHVVIILEESLGARYVGHLTGAPTTPELDKIAHESWTFTNLFATGTRSVRGIEAVVTGFLPTPARAVVKLGLAQDNFFTLANVFNDNGYASTFIYGGESHFDNMRGFLLNNGFQNVIDRPTFRDIVFEGTWGVSDEDMFNRLHQELSKARAPQFIFAFSVSNHSPYEFPAGRVISGKGENSDKLDAIRYADWAIGDFFRKAKGSQYFQNTIFLLVADHDSRVYGASLVPLEHFHIPGMFLGPKVPRRFDDRLVSQIDLAPTLLSLAGIDTYHPMLGRDLNDTSEPWRGRALMQYGENFGYRYENNLVVLQPHLEAKQYLVGDGNRLTPVPVQESFQRIALAHALWPSWAYRNRRYNPKYNQ